MRKVFSLTVLAFTAEPSVTVFPTIRILGYVNDESLVCKFSSHIIISCVISFNQFLWYITRTMLTNNNGPSFAGLNIFWYKKNP